MVWMNDAVKLLENSTATQKYFAFSIARYGSKGVCLAYDKDTNTGTEVFC